MLSESPAFEAKTLFEVLVGKYPGRYDEGQLRTLQRRVKAWRAERGPDKEVILAQRHRPGEAAQTDFTWTTELAITIAGELFIHMLCVFVLPYSNWRVGERLLVGIDRVDPTRRSARTLPTRDACPCITRRTTPPRPRTGSPTPRASSARAAASGRSTRTTSRSCGTSA